MRSLSRQADYEILTNRLSTVAVDDSARWGRMNAYQMICHLGAAIRVPLGEIQVSEISERTSLFSQTLIKWGAFWVPRPWPKGVPTRPELDQCALGICEGEFAAKQTDVLHQLDRLRRTKVEGVRHFLFGALSQTEWMRWGWLHTDHHLRQFGR
jgi:Protein of unknown function (DUF1569)